MSLADLIALALEVAAAILNVADVGLTEEVILLGGAEVNPWIDWLKSKLDLNWAFFIAKIPVMLILGTWLAVFHGSWWGVLTPAVITAIYTAVVINNVIALREQRSIDKQEIS